MYMYLSTCYDDFMSNVNYDAWANKIAEKIGDRKKGMDCGCGSGSITMRLKKMGYDVVGADISDEMLMVAAKNFARENLSIPLIKMDAAKLVVGNKMDFITATCDVVNYMKKPENFFQRAFTALNKGGVLVFDISSRYKLTQIIGNNVFTDSTDNVTYVWSNCLSKKKDYVEMFLTFFIKNSENNYEKKEERQVQYIYDAEYLATLMEKVGFSDVKYEFFSPSPTAGKEERLFFSAYKKG